MCFCVTVGAPPSLYHLPSPMSLPCPSLHSSPGPPAITKTLSMSFTTWIGQKSAYYRKHGFLHFRVEWVILTNVYHTYSMQYQCLRYRQDRVLDCYCLLDLPRHNIHPWPSNPSIHPSVDFRLNIFRQVIYYAAPTLLHTFFFFFLPTWRLRPRGQV